MKRCVDCERWLNCDRATKEIICDDFVKGNRNIMKLSKKECGYFEFERLEEDSE